MLPQKRSFINLSDVRGESAQNIAKGSEVDIRSRSLSDHLLLFGMYFKLLTCLTCEKTFAQELLLHEGGVEDRRLKTNQEWRAFMAGQTWVEEWEGERKRTGRFAGGR